MSHWRLAALAAAILVPGALWASAAQLTLAPVQDTTIFAENFDYSSGAGPFLFIGGTAMGSLRRALLQFDLSGIPAGSVISSVSLRIFVDRSGTASSSTDAATLHRLTESWAEGTSHASGGDGAQASAEDATWAYRVHGDPLAGIPRIPWSASSGTFISDSSGETLLTSIGTLTFQSSTGLVADVQGWVDDPSSNAGWIMLGNEERGQTALRLLSRTSGALANRPELTVVYASIPEPATHALLIGGLAITGAVTRWRLRRMRRAVGKACA